MTKASSGDSRNPSTPCNPLTQSSTLPRILLHRTEHTRVLRVFICESKTSYRKEYENEKYNDCRIHDCRYFGWKRNVCQPQRPQQARCEQLQTSPYPCGENAA